MDGSGEVEEEANTLVLRAADDAPAEPVYENGLIAFGLGAALGLGAHAPAVLDFLQGVARSAANGGDLEAGRRAEARRRGDGASPTARGLALAAFASDPRA